MKRCYLLVTLCLLAIALSNKFRNKLRNKKFDLMFSTESQTKSNDKPKLMEHIISGKPIKVSTNFSTEGEENLATKPNKIPDLVKDQRFKQDNNKTRLNLNNLESPKIVKSLGYETPFNIENRVASQLDQTITNRQAYDLVYPTHRSYYNDKRFIVIDRNFNQVESYMLNQFKAAIDSAIDYSSNAKLEHVEDFDKNKVNLKELNIQNSAPFVPADAVATSIKYDEIYPDSKNIKITSSDPYASIFGGHIK